MKRRDSTTARCRGGALAAVAALAIWGCAGPPAEPVRIGSRAPGFVLPALDGGELDSETLVGTPVVLNFWATWCQPCRKEFPVLGALDRDPRVKVVTIALDEDGAKSVRPFVQREGLAYTVLLGDQEIFERFSGFTIPLTLVLDRSQTVVSLYRGPASQEVLEGDLSKILEGAGEETAATP